MPQWHDARGSRQLLRRPALTWAARFARCDAIAIDIREQELKEEIKVVIGEIDRNESNPFYLNRTLMDKLCADNPEPKNALGTQNGSRRR